jgi:hypothetical protein
MDGATIRSSGVQEIMSRGDMIPSDDQKKYSEKI